MSQTPPNTVQATGSDAGDLLVGFAKHNEGLIVQPSQEQPVGRGKRILGPVRILHAGTGRYNKGVRNLLDTTVEFESSDDFISRLSKESGCENATHALNANALWKLSVSAVSDRLLTDYVAEVDRPAIAIHIKQQYPFVETAEDLYTCTRGLWRVDMNHAKLAELAFAVFEGEVKEVYEIHGWEPTNAESDRYWHERCLAKQGRVLPADINVGRHQFIGNVAREDIRQKYLGKMLPLRHVQYPILYFNC